MIASVLKGRELLVFGIEQMEAVTLKLMTELILSISAKSKINICVSTLLSLKLNLNHTRVLLPMLKKKSQNNTFGGTSSMRNKKKSYLLGSVFATLALSVASCSTNVWVDELDFYGRFLRWQDKEGIITIDVQGKRGYEGKARIKIGNDVHNAYISICSSRGSYPSLVVVELDEEENQKIILLNKRRVRDNNGTYYSDRFEIYDDSGNEAIDGLPITLFSSPIPTDSLDARLMGLTTFINKEMGVNITPADAHQLQPYKWLLNYESFSDFSVTFGDDRTFFISGSVNSYGTYTPTREDIAFHFEHDEIFNLEGQSLTFTYDFN